MRPGPRSFPEFPPASLAHPWHPSCQIGPVAFNRLGRDQRREPRVDVYMQVRGELVSLNTPIVIHDMSRTGFSVVSPTPFEKGETLDFRLMGDDGPGIRVTACAVHSRPVEGAPGLHVSGFMFIPGKLTGLVPQSSIDRLIAAVTPAASCL